MLFGPIDEPVPEPELSSERMAHLLVEIKRNSRHRRIAMVSTVLLVAAVMGALLAAPPQHGGLALTADADGADPALPRVFGSGGVWRLAEPIADDPDALGPASVVEAPTSPDAPSFSLSPPDEEDLNSLPTSPSTPPTATLGQSPVTTGEPTEDPAERDWSNFTSIIVIEPEVDVLIDADPDAEIDPGAAIDPDTALDPDTEAPADGLTNDVVEVAAEPGGDASATDAEAAPATAADSAEALPVAEDQRSTPEDTSPTSSSEESPVDESTPASDNTPTAVEPQSATADPTQANPSTPVVDPPEGDSLALSVPASIVSPSVVVYSAHVSVTVQVVDDDSSVIDWCNTRVDWGDGSVSRATGVDDAALCTAPCERSAQSSTSGISEQIVFEHDYLQTIDAAPRIFVATGDGCSYSLAELQLPPFTVVPLR